MEFKLMDSSGTCVQCCALGKHASNPMLKPCVEVLIYFGTGRGPIGGLDGMLYVMKDAACFPVVDHDAMPVKSLNIVITSRQ